MFKTLIHKFAQVSLRSIETHRISENFCRQISTAQIFSHSIRDAHGVKDKISTEAQEGTEGSQTLLSIRTDYIDRYLPDATTLRKEFNGIPYEELPVIYIKCSRNNTLIHAFDDKNVPIVYTSCRKEGFKHARKKTNIAGQTTGMAAGQKLLRRGVQTVRVILRGIGPGRMTSVKGLAASGIQIISISDRSFLPELGPRPRKIRRI